MRIELQNNYVSQNYQNAFEVVYLIHLNKKIIIGTCVTYFAKLEEKFDLQVIEKIPNG